MPVCSFCKQSYEFPKGVTLVKKDGNIRFYCSSKCRKNSEIGRDNKKVKWIKKSEIVKQEKAKKEEAKKILLEEKSKKNPKKEKSRKKK